MTCRPRWVILFRLSSVVLTLFAVAWILWFMPTLEAGSSGLPDYGEIHKFDPAREGGHLLPNLDEWMQGGRRDQRVRIVTNSKGFRNRKEFSREVPAGTLRILLLGDSFVDGMRTDQEDTIGAVLERGLKSGLANTRWSDVEVMVSGHNNPCDAWYAYQEHGRRFAPQLVVLGVTLGNDLTWQGYRRWMMPVTGADGAPGLRFDATANAYLFPINVGVMLPPTAFEPEPAWGFLTRAEMNVRSFLADRFRFAGDSIPMPTNPWVSERGRVHAADFTLSLGIFGRPLMPEAEQWFADLEEVLAGMNGEVDRSGSRLLVLLFPVRVQVDAKSWDLTRRAYGLKEAAFDLDAPNRRIDACCRRLGVPCLDPSDELRAGAKKGEGPFFRPRGDMHFNEAGQRLCAEFLRQYLAGHTLP